MPNEDYEHHCREAAKLLFRMQRDGFMFNAGINRFIEIYLRGIPGHRLDPNKFLEEFLIYNGERAKIVVGISGAFVVYANRAGQYPKPKMNRSIEEYEALNEFNDFLHRRRRYRDGRCTPADKHKAVLGLDAGECSGIRYDFECRRRGCYEAQRGRSEFSSVHFANCDDPEPVVDDDESDSRANSGNGHPVAYDRCSLSNQLSGR